MSEREVRIKVGDIVIWYPNGIPSYERGVPCVVHRIEPRDMTTVSVRELRFQCIEHSIVPWMHGPQGQDEKLTRSYGCWGTKEDHHDLLLSVRREMERKEKQARDEAVRRDEDMQVRRAAVNLVRSGKKTLAEVALESGMDEEILRELVESQAFTAVV